MLIAAVFAVLALAAVTPLLVRLLGRDAGYLGALGLTGIAVWLASQAPAVLDGEPVTSELRWIPQADVAFSLRMDALGLLFAVIVLGIGAVVLAYAARYFGREQGAKASRYLALLTFFAGAMLGLVLADDAIVLFVFWELTSISSFFLIGGLGEGKAGATRALLVTSIGGLALFAGAILLGVVGGTTSLSALAADPAAVVASPLAPLIVVLLLVAVATKSAQVPFHFWLPGAMVAPTPVSTYLHAATMVKAGIYLLFRTTGILSEVPMWTPTLVVLGGVTAVYAAFVAVTQDDLKGLLAFSTVSQLGMIVLVLGVGTPLAVGVAALYTLSHALYKATLFMTVGIVDHETGTRSLAQLGGLRRTLPLTAVAGALAAISMAGLLPLVGFVAKEEAFHALIAGTDLAWVGPVGVTLAVLASFGTFAYSARYYFGTFEGPVRTEAHRAPIGFALPAFLTGAAGLALGLLVPVLDTTVNAVARDATATDPHLHLALWHGFTLPLGLSGLVVLVGTTLFLRRDRVIATLTRRRLPRGEDVFDRSYDGLLALGGRIGRSAVPDSPAAYLLPILAVALVTVGIVTAGLDRTLLGPPAPSLPGDAVVIVLLLGSAGTAVAARGRLAAIAALGLTGFTVAVWFVLLGAPDLALTQLLIETLTVALVVLVFRRLPGRFPDAGDRRRGVAVVAALLVGTGVTIATYLATGRRELSEVGQRLLAEGEGLTGGANVVNTILVDFRALDTLGEVVVLAVAALGILALVRLVPRDAVPAPRDLTDAAESEPALGDARFGGPGMIGSPILATASHLLSPAMIIASLWLLVRGHDAVGGGFIGGLVAGSAVVLHYFSHGHAEVWHRRTTRTVPTMGIGVFIAAGYGLAGLAVTGSFLAGGKIPVPIVDYVAASLVFDIGVYIVVVGLVAAIIRHLGQGVGPHELPGDDDRPTDLASVEKVPSTTAGGGA
ncbi:hydrogen gas-evolving membrane-bound hydrogenase subunit E [Nitriliruptor alkaliphilus]|uniref:hydrogen gas-evolving membrane-bound hydrogenase subunit E n=1 Tax=Nitriliruptor alkaliphilus TaxID=427918 RepID=UPI00069628BA|nr:hydrogen gas-evolving membrane-bound hydrogenase subunit E [Nitriliruptor alkaliphilus]